MARVPCPWACLLPRAEGAELDDLVDTIELPRDQVPYAAYAVNCRGRASKARSLVTDVVQRSGLVYCGPSEWLNEFAAHICQKKEIPYIVTTEISLRTQLDIMRVQTPSLSRRVWRGLKVRRSFQRQKRIIRHAEEYHANGYPTYEAFHAVNTRRRLYFDSRIGDDDVISLQGLKNRLRELHHDRRTPRFVYTGRYHPIKGVLDVVHAGIQLMRQGVSFRLDLYGTGPLKESLREMVHNERAGSHIFVNDSIPFRPDLLTVVGQSDLFLCCHAQGDPSCTYLETFSRGVPIVGYDNEMWSPLCQHSAAGVVVTRRDPVVLADCVRAVLNDGPRLARLSYAARDFARAHSMVRAWDIRCSGIRGGLTQGA